MIINIISALNISGYFSVWFPAPYSYLFHIFSILLKPLTIPLPSYRQKTLLFTAERKLKLSHENSLIFPKPN